MARSEVAYGVIQLKHPAQVHSLCMRATTKGGDHLVGNVGLPRTYSTATRRQKQKSLPRVHFYESAFLRVVSHEMPL